jgi:excisionase family DNA binding protein
MPQIVILQSEDDLRLISESIAEKVLQIIKCQMPEKESKAPMVTPKELAEELKISRDLVYRLAREGKMPCERIGSNLRFNVTEVKAALRPERKGGK